MGCFFILLFTGIGFALGGPIGATVGLIAGFVVAYGIGQESKDVQPPENPDYEPYDRSADYDEPDHYPDDDD